MQRFYDVLTLKLSVHEYGHGCKFGETKMDLSAISLKPRSALRRERPRCNMILFVNVMHVYMWLIMFVNACLKIKFYFVKI